MPGRERVRLENVVVNHKLVHRAREKSVHRLWGDRVIEFVVEFEDRGHLRVIDPLEKSVYLVKIVLAIAHGRNLGQDDAQLELLQGVCDIFVQLSKLLGELFELWD